MQLDPFSRLVLPFLALGATGSVAPAQFGPKQVISDQVGSARSVHAGDLDGDGDPDVVACGISGPAAIVWFENLGGGAFGPAQLFPDQPANALDVFVADLDADGDADVLAGSDYYLPQYGRDYRVVRYVNDGAGSFTTQWLGFDEDSPDRIYVSDMDGDGDVDVLYAAWSDRIYWFEGLGGGAFSGRQTVTTDGGGIQDAYPADLDGDGDEDVLTGWYSDEVAWYENLGGGAFGAKQVITTLVDNALAVRAADLDGDGDLDVLSASIFDKVLAWYENLGSGAFGPQQVISTTGNPGYGVEAVDLDCDGDLDVLSADVLGASWYENTGAGSFGPRQEIEGDSLSVRVAHPVDLDRNGRLDVLIAASTDATIAWFENRMPAPVATVYCDPAAPNSTGGPATVCAAGSSEVADDDLSLRAAGMPPHKPGYFLVSATQGFVANPGGSAGNLCLGGRIARFRKLVQSSGAAGTFAIEVDLAGLPYNPPVPVVPGDAWSFQAWFRDAGGTSNFTHGLEIEFL